MNGAVNFTVAADDAVQFVISGALGQIRAIHSKIFAFFIFIAVFLFGVSVFRLIDYGNLRRVNHIVLVVFSVLTSREHPLEERQRQRAAGLEALFAVHIFHHLFHLLGNFFHFVFGNAHLLHNLFHGADIQFQSTFYTQTLVGRFVTVHFGNEKDGGVFVASAAQHVFVHG